MRAVVLFCVLKYLLYRRYTIPLSSRAANSLGGTARPVCVTVSVAFSIFSIMAKLFGGLSRKYRLSYGEGSKVSLEAAQKCSSRALKSHDVSCQRRRSQSIGSRSNQLNSLRSPITKSHLLREHISSALGRVQVELFQRK